MDRTVSARHYTVVEDSVIDDERLTSYGLLSYLAIRRHVGADGICWPSVARVAKLMRCSTRTAAKALNELEEAGYLARDSGQADGTSNRYTLFDCRVDTLPRHDVPTPSAPGAYPPRHVVPTEVSPEEVHPLKTIPAVAGSTSTAVAKRRGRTRSENELAFHKEVWEKMELVLGAKLEGVAQGVNLWRLIDFAKKTDGEHWEGLINTMLHTFLMLQKGKIRTKDKRFAESPFTPAKVYYLRYEILEHMRVKQHESPFAEYAQEEARA